MISQPHDRKVCGNELIIVVPGRGGGEGGKKVVENTKK